MRTLLTLSAIVTLLACSPVSPATLPDDAGHDAGGEADRSVVVPFDAAAPHLLDITISPLGLTPAFSPSIHDYYMTCAAGVNPVDVTVTASEGATATITLPSGSSASQFKNVSLSVNEGDAIVVKVTEKSASTEYWIRCLPHDFPPLRMTLHPEVGTPTPGYYLVGNTNFGSSPQSGYAMALDVNGVPVWYHTTKNGLGGIAVDNLIPGVISFLPSLDGNYSFSTVSVEMELHDLAAGTTKYVEPVGSPLNPHEFQVLPNGDYLMFSSPVITGVDLSAFGAPFGKNDNVADCFIQQVTPAGAEVWHWHVTDHFDAVSDSTFPQMVSSRGLEVADVFHCNSIDIQSNGNLLLSAKSMDTVFMIEYPSGKVLWKMGGKPANKDDAPYVAVMDDPETAFYRQHDVRMLPNGNISMYDDHTDVTGDARAVIYSYDVSAGSAKVVWQHLLPHGVFAMGAFRVAADGSSVIGWGATSDQAITELDAKGNDVLDFVFPDGTQSYRALKIPTSAFDIQLLRTTAGKN